MVETKKISSESTPRTIPKTFMETLNSFKAKKDYEPQPHIEELILSFKATGLSPTINNIRKHISNTLSDELLEDIIDSGFGRIKPNLSNEQMDQLNIEYSKYLESLFDLNDDEKEEDEKEKDEDEKDDEKEEDDGKEEEDDGKEEEDDGKEEEDDGKEEEGGDNN